MTQDDDAIDRMMRELGARAVQPRDVPVDAMWKQIEAAHYDGNRAPVRRWPRWLAQGIGLAATLVIGVGIGRSTLRSERPTDAAVVQQVFPGDVAMSADVNPSYRVATAQYLGDMNALLVALPATQKAGASDSLYSRARELLSTTRLLMDTPASADPELQTLLTDLELVLAQVVRMTARSSSGELDLINEALRERAVLARLQSVVKSLPAAATN